MDKEKTPVREQKETSLQDKFQKYVETMPNMKISKDLGIDVFQVRRLKKGYNVEVPFQNLLKLLSR